MYSLIVNEFRIQLATTNLFSALKTSTAMQRAVQFSSVCVYPFFREGGINLFGGHRGSILLNGAEISQEG